jgi:isoquinoline 1-oxidoreductase subunit beta
MAQVAEVEVSKDDVVRVRRVVCALDCGSVVDPDTVEALRGMPIDPAVLERPA